MEEYDFEIEHRSATKHGNADALSRRPCTKQSCYCHNLVGGQLDDEVHVRVTELRLADALDFGWAKVDLAKQQTEDAALALI